MTRVCFESYYIYAEENPADIVRGFRDTDLGHWLSDRGVVIDWRTTLDPSTYCHKLTITGKMTEDQYLEWILRWR